MALAESWSRQMGDWIISDWSKSGAGAPYSYGGVAPRDDIVRNHLRHDHRKRRSSFGLAVATAFLISIPFPHSVLARDVGQFAASTPEMKAWFDSLRSGKGPCCSDTDGSAVSDVDWESYGGHYRVRLDQTWFDVPDEAVITGPNRVGRTMVWPLRLESGMLIRCFMPGSMT